MSKSDSDMDNGRVDHHHACWPVRLCGFYPWCRRRTDVGRGPSWVAPVAPAVVCLHLLCCKKQIAGGQRRAEMEMSTARASSTRTGGRTRTRRRCVTATMAISSACRLNGHKTGGWLANLGKALAALALALLFQAAGASGSTRSVLRPRLPPASRLVFMCSLAAATPELPSSTTAVLDQPRLVSFAHTRLSVPTRCHQPQLHHQLHLIHSIFTTHTAKMRFSTSVVLAAVAIGAQALPQDVQPITQISDGQIQVSFAAASTVDAHN